MYAVVRRTAVTTAATRTDHLTIARDLAATRKWC
jgi:hypothetical protein